MLRLAFYVAVVLIATLYCSAVTWAAPNLSYGPYHADHIRTLDGDTVELSLHIFPGMYYVTKIRERTIDTPETGWRAISSCERKLGKAASEYTDALVTNAEVITVDEVGFGSFVGRMVGKIYIDGVPLGTLLQERGFAVPYLSTKSQRAAVTWCHES